jgi:hypothetical protein
VRWDNLMDMIQHLGFPSKCRDWILAIITTSSSRVLLNGIFAKPIKHRWGLRQGDPLSPLLFVLAIDPLHHLLRKATGQGHLHRINGRSPTIRTSLYADVCCHLRQAYQEWCTFLASTLRKFGDVTGLVTNCVKSQVAPNRYDGINPHDILQPFPATRVNFPMWYLGLPLSVKRLKRVHFQPLEDKVPIKLTHFIGKHVTMARRTTLVKSVLTSIVIYFITVHDVPIEVLMKIDSLWRAFL